MVATKTRQIARAGALALLCTLSFRALAAEPMAGIRLDLRSQTKPTPGTALEVSVLREGEGIASRTFAVPDAPSALLAIEVEWPQALPWSARLDLEVDLRVVAEGQWAFRIESTEIVSGRGIRHAGVFGDPASRDLTSGEERGLEGPTHRLGPNRRGITLHAGPEGCPTPTGADR